MGFHESRDLRVWLNLDAWYFRTLWHKILSFLNLIYHCIYSTHKHAANGVMQQSTRLICELERLKQTVKPGQEVGRDYVMLNCYKQPETKPGGIKTNKSQLCWPCDNIKKGPPDIHFPTSRWVHCEYFYLFLLPTTVIQSHNSSCEQKCCSLKNNNILLLIVVSVATRNHSCFLFWL